MADHEHGGGDDHGGEHKKHKKHFPHRHEEHEHEEGWIVSFADNVLLMMGFFVILLAMNMGPKGSSDGAAGDTAEDRMADVAIAVREAFNNPVSMMSLAPEDQPLIRRLRSKMQSGTGPGGTDGQDEESETVRPSDWSGDGSFVHFGEREAILTESARVSLAEISQRIVGTRWMVEVRGHSSAWETWRDTKKSRDLAYDRAWAVASELVRNGVKWEQIRLSSSGSSAPVIARARTSDEAQTNQRAEILVLREVMPADPYANSPAREKGESMSLDAAPSDPDHGGD